MRVRRFEIHGYKNLRRTLRLEDLGQVCVFHGDNNVGKSNLLEAVGLLWVMIRALGDELRGSPMLAGRPLRNPVRKPQQTDTPSIVRSSSFFQELGFAPEDIFDLAHPQQPIELVATLELGAGDIRPDDPPELTQPMQLTLRLDRGQDELTLSLVALRLQDGSDLAAKESPKEQLALVLERLGPQRRGKSLMPRFMLLRADRTILSDVPADLTNATPLWTQQPLPQELGLALYDAEAATDAYRKERYKLFVQSLSTFETQLGEGRWRIRYERDLDRAELYFETERDGDLTLIPLRLMGSGIQQLSNLVARIVMSGADIVALEEPELNLRYDTQLRLREVLGNLSASGTAGFQLLMASHSPAFEMEREFYALRPSPQGPIVERRPAASAARFTAPETDVPPAQARAPLSYVTTDGLVRLPLQVRKDLGLENGGGVVLVQEKESGHYRLLTDDQFLDLIEPEAKAQ